jgi:hypothetical protein
VRCPLLVARGEDGSRRFVNCYGIILWSLVGASNEERRDYLEGICEEDKLDTGGRDFGDEL